VQSDNTKARREAANAGRKTYFTGVPCKHGHMCARYVTNGGCLECVTMKRLKLPAPEYVFTPPPVLLFEPIRPEHVELLKQYFVNWTDQTLKGWGYRTFADGPIVIPYEFVPRAPQGSAK
jgi:hypothetical protein